MPTKLLMRLAAQNPTYYRSNVTGLRQSLTLWQMRWPDTVSPPGGVTDLLSRRCTWEAWQSWISVGSCATAGIQLVLVVAVKLELAVRVGDIGSTAAESRRDSERSTPRISDYFRSVTTTLRCGTAAAADAADSVSVSARATLAVLCCGTRSTACR